MQILRRSMMTEAEKRSIARIKDYLVSKGLRKSDEQIEDFRSAQHRLSGAVHYLITLRECANRSGGKALRALYVENTADLDAVPAVSGNRVPRKETTCILRVDSSVPVLGLWLDDHRKPPQTINIVWDHVSDLKEFTDALHNRAYDIVSFDHDLHRSHTMWFFANGGHQNPPDPSSINFNPPNGSSCAMALVALQRSRQMPLPVCVVHTHNPYGAQNIAKILLEYCLETGHPPRILVARAESSVM